MFGSGRPFGVNGLARHGTAGADDVLYRTVTQYRAATGQHWVKLRTGGTVLRPCRQSVTGDCPWCSPATADFVACGACIDRAAPCRRCEKKQHHNQQERAATTTRRIQRDRALTEWLADPRRSLPLAWRHPIPPQDPMWRYDLRTGEHVTDGTGVGNRRVRPQPCPPDNECPQCRYAVDIMRLGDIEK